MLYVYFFLQALTFSCLLTSLFFFFLNVLDNNADESEWIENKSSDISVEEMSDDR